MKKCLLIVGMQNDFSENGALPVPGFSDIIQGINKKIENYISGDQIIMAAKDWHPKNHISFKDSTWDQSLQGSLWPKHCIKNTHGAQLDNRLQLNKVGYEVTRGDDLMIGTYSVFKDANGNWNEDVKKIFEKEEIKEIEIVGVAGEYCIKHTSFDAAELGYEVFANQELIKYIDEANIEPTLNAFKEKLIKY
ncbi:isochorismatase family protein [Mycoplasma todarodis]|uniref:nicotinamidase n=1 Tax=Mycoplasma todarodis TaxID=1937191 RepID=A0A4R0XLT2_9MOLU|nr:isochorismatase family protein [Mycoplasma todarodis]TCG11666.1 hypothetical protein C4B25_00965 [Mycoplasma todarodis]